MMKKMLILVLIGVFVLSGCEQLKELYGVQSGKEEYVPLEEIKVKEEPTAETPPTPPAEEIPSAPPEVLPVQEETPAAPEAKEEKPAAEEKPRGEAKAIIVKETELVSLKPKVTDPDADKLAFTYSTPFNKEGRWQTKYGDAGEYTVTITASDGQSSVTKDVLIIVNKKEEAPVIDEAMPKEDKLEAKESSKLEFSVKASDLNKDALTYSWKLDNNEVSKEKSYTYDVGYDAAGQHNIRVVVSDGAKEASKAWTVNVANVNRKPVLEKIADIKAKETETIVLEPKATDPDNDKVTFSVDNAKLKKTDGKFEWKTTYDDSGEYTVKVSASDGTDTASQDVKITIENVNRPPVIEDIVLG